MKIYSIGSSSSGNSYIVKVGEANFLLDVGLSARKIVSAIEQVGLSALDIDAIFITHEHIDHVRSVKAIAKKCPEAVIYVSRGTYEACDSLKEIDEERINFLEANQQIYFVPKDSDDNTSGVEISCFSLSHDAKEPIGFSFEEVDFGKATFVTDTGIITDEIFEEMKSSDSLVFEANHEENLLMMGEYPYNVKMRIKSDYGHLSNVTSAETIAKLLDSRESDKELNIMLAHLSEKNNTPYQARLTIEDILRTSGYERDKDYTMTIAAKEGLTEL